VVDEVGLVRRRGRRRPEGGPSIRALAFGAPIVAFLFVAWGCNAVQAPMPLARLLVTDEVRLDVPLPHIVQGPVFFARGITQPNALVQPVVDTTVFDAKMAEPDGRFLVAVPIADLGIHDVRIEVRLRSLADPIAELIEGQVTRVGATLPPPRLLAVQPDPEGQDAFWILVATTPWATVTGEGATLELLSRAASLPRGRHLFRVAREGPATSRVRLTAHAGPGSSSLQTPELDLAQLAETGTTQEERDSTNAAIVYTIDRYGISRTQSVTLAPDRPELTELTVGRLEALAFLQTVSGKAGLAPGPGQSCSLGRYGSDLPDVEIGDLANVTFRDTFPDFITSTNGFADRPKLSLCFPEGLPVFGNTGYLEVRIADYAVVSTNPRPAAVSIERPESGPIQRVYRWDHLPIGGRVDLVLAVDVQTSLGLLPKAQIGNLITDPEVGSLLSGVVYAIFQALGILLLLWLTASSSARAQFRDPSRTAASDILTLAVAFAFLPAVADATSTLGYRAYASVPGLLGPLAEPLRQPPDVIGTCALALLVIAISWLAARWLRKRLLWSRLAAALAVASALWLYAVVAGRALILIAGGAGPAASSSVAAWVVGASLVLLAIAFGRWRFSPLRHALRRLARGAPRVSRRGTEDGQDWWARIRPRRLRWPRRSSPMALAAIIAASVLAAIVLGFPSGQRMPSPEALGGPEALFDFVIRQFVSLLAYGYALFGLAVVVVLVRDAWFGVPWELLVADARGRDGEGGEREDTEELLKRTGRAIFAGFVIGTAGVFAVIPLPFFIAFPLFDRLLLRPVAEIAELAREAPIIRAERARLLSESIRKGLAPDEDDPPPAIETTPSKQASRSPSRSLARSPSPSRSSADVSNPFRVGNVAALGPEDSVWGNVALGLKIGAALTAGLVVLYVGQYPFASVTTEDPYYLQRFGLDVAAFVGSWLIVGFLFGLMYEHLRGQSGMQKGLLLGGAILALTLPFQLLSTLASGLPLISITIRVLQVLAFTALLGVAFDLRLMRRVGRLRMGRPRRVLHDLGGMSGSGQVATAVLFIVGSIIGTVGTVVTGQLTQLLTRILTPFLPLPN
jgi:hypothetical protein